MYRQTRFYMTATVARAGVLALLALASLHLIHAQQRPSDLLQNFEHETVFWRQFEIAKAIVTAKDASILPRLEPWLTNQDRHTRGNAAFIFAGLGDPRGFDVILAILADRSEDREVHLPSSVGTPWVAGQIREDRYYAAHLLGDLKDPRGVPVLVRLLTDRDVNYIVPWSLAQIGDRSAIAPLIGSLQDTDPNMRVLVIHALAGLNATEALPQLRALRNDDAKSTFDKFEPVSGAARSAIAKLESAR